MRLLFEAQVVKDFLLYCPQCLSQAMNQRGTATHFNSMDVNLFTLADPSPKSQSIMVFAPLTYSNRHSMKFILVSIKMFRVHCHT